MLMKCALALNVLIDYAFRVELVKIGIQEFSFVWLDGPFFGIQIGESHQIQHFSHTIIQGDNRRRYARLQASYSTMESALKRERSVG